ncbi:MAG TPA: response regulator transcription factor [Gemmatimonadales bacterium]|nr:response regulator transcription factor [Gemmatimonadales bacterium]
MSAGTRILVFEDDGAPAPFDSIPPPEHASVTAVTEDPQRAVAMGYPTDTEPRVAERVRVLTPAAMRQLRALFARITHLLGIGSAATPAAELCFGELTVDPQSRAVVRAGRRIDLSRKEFDLLSALIRRRGAVASRQDLVHEVWGPVTRVHHRVVDTHIARLRRKVEDTPAHPRYILTAVALGYRFAAAPEKAGAGEPP